MKSIYLSYTKDQIENLVSNYIIGSWSYSKLNCFRNNEAKFEMQYIYLAPTKKSASAIAGSAYHEAMKVYFSAFNYMEDKKPDYDELKDAADAYIAGIDPDSIALSKTLPDADTALAECRKNAYAAIQFFCDEYETYTSDIAEVISVEEKKETWIAVNGVSIPLPLHYITDLVIRTKDGKLVILDHKTKKTATDADSIPRTYYEQGLIYALGLESLGDCKVDELWFMEIKTSRNKNKSAQITRNVIVLDEAFRSQYERELYLPIKRMMKALADPNYEYLYNPSDQLCNHEELLAFRQQHSLDTRERVPSQAALDLVERRNRRNAAVGKADRKVYQYSVDGVLIGEWASVREAEHDLGYSRAAIMRCCNGRRKTCGGYIWTYSKTA